MSMAPFGARPVSPRTDRSRTRLALTIASIGIAATLLAYAVSPGVRHAVSHAAHSVKHAVGNVIDHDTSRHARPRHPAPAKHAAKVARPASPSSSQAPAQQQPNPPARTSTAAGAGR